MYHYGTRELIISEVECSSLFKMTWQAALASSKLTSSDSEVCLPKNLVGFWETGTTLIQISPKINNKKIFNSERIRNLIRLKTCIY